MINAHIDRETKRIDGVLFTNTHSGQKNAYGDSFYEYEVSSELPAEEVERICRERVYQAMPESQYLAERKIDRSADAYFRAHYKFTPKGVGRYFYQVCFPYAD
jgi:hypothetical protein